MMREINLTTWRDYSKKYYKDHAEHIIEKHSEARKKYKDEHHEEILEKNRVYAQKLLAKNGQKSMPI